MEVKEDDDLLTVEPLAGRDDDGDDEKEYTDGGWVMDGSGI